MNPVSGFLYSVAVMFGTAGLCVLAIQELSEPWAFPVAFATAFAGGRLAERLYPVWAA